MSYINYRLKVNGVQIPNSFAQKGSYSITEEDRVVETWKDADHIEHVVICGKRRTITFSIREHSTDEHATLMAAFVNRNHVPVVYFDDVTQTYIEGDFRIPAFTFSHRNTGPNEIRYNATVIKMEEY